MSRRMTDVVVARVLASRLGHSTQAHLPMLEAAADHAGVLTDEPLAELGFGGGR